MAANTIWDSFLTKRRHSSRIFVYRSLLRILIGWLFYLFITIFPLTQDARTTPLVPLFAAFQAAQTTLLVLTVVVTKCKCFKETYTLWVTVAFGVFILINFSRGIVVDVLVRRNEFYSGDIEDLTAATVIASGVFGSHEILLTLVALDTVRVVIWERKYLYALFLGLPTTMTIIGLLQIAIDSRVSFRSLSSEHFITPLVKVILSIIASLLAANMRISNEWHSYVTRKRLQLECIRTEELLKLAMPKEIAHQQMMGRLKPVRYDCASVGFIYIVNYAEFVRSASTSGCNVK